MFTLRNYQKDLKSGIYCSWQAGNRNVCVVSPTGSGKTVLMSSVAYDMTGPGVAIAHRAELVSQISLTLAKMGVEHRIIGSTTTVRFCIQQQITEIGRSYVNQSEHTKVTVAAVDTLKSRSDRLMQWASRQRWWMIDECFVSGTNVTMADGSLQYIERVNVGDEVLAFDDRTGMFAAKRVTKTYRSEMPPCILRIATSGVTLDVTSGHPFWTKRGWVRAGELRHDDEIYTTTLHSVRDDSGRDNGIAKVQLAQKGSDILHSAVRVHAQGCEPKTPAIGTDQSLLCDVREKSHSGSGDNASLSSVGSGVLQQDLFKHLRIQNIIGNYVADEPQVCVRSNEETQPDEECISSWESIGAIARDRAQAIAERRQRETTNRSGSEIDGDARPLGVRGSTGCRDGVGARPRTEPLQDRLRTRLAENSDRGGRPKSCVTESSEIGCEEGRFFAWRRLESIQVLKRNDSSLTGDGRVYNLEVDGLHTYIANGVVVHNCHHVLQANKWGAAVQMFPNAHGIGVTATPLRADRKALHADHGGVFHDLIVGPTMRQLINEGSLCDYRIFAPPQSFFMAQEDIGSTGDYKATALRANAHKSKIVGDIVGHYKKLAMGKRGITFTVDVAQAIELEQAFNAAGVPAMAVSAKSGDTARAEAIRKFRDGRVLQLINVDLFGEGFDVPAVEVVSMGRPTMSYGLYVQQFGRALRVLKGKEHGLIIDHVGNVKAHGLPDAPREWSLYGPERGKRNIAEQNVMPMTSCSKCFYGYEAFLKACPFCGHKPEPAGRKAPEQVQGDLIELDPAILAKMRGEVEATDARLQNPLMPVGADRVTTIAIKNRAMDRAAQQTKLREAIAQWAGFYHHSGHSDSEIHRRFWFRFGTDVMSAQVLNRADAEKLETSINEDIQWLMKKHI